jgi:hypothetical protein
MSNTFTNLLYHLVFSTKNRKDLIQLGFRLPNSPIEYISLLLICVLE